MICQRYLQNRRDTSHLKDRGSQNSAITAYDQNVRLEERREIRTSKYGRELAIEGSRIQACRFTTVNYVGFLG